MQSNLCFSHMIHIMLLTISADVHVFLLLDFFLFQLFLIEHPLCFARFRSNLIFAGFSISRSAF